MPVSGFGPGQHAGRRKEITYPSGFRLVLCSQGKPEGRVSAVAVLAGEVAPTRHERTVKRRVKKKNACVFTVSSSHVDVSVARSSVAESPRRDLRNTRQDRLTRGLPKNEKRARGDVADSRRGVFRSLVGRSTAAERWSGDETGRSLFAVVRGVDIHTRAT